MPCKNGSIGCRGRLTFVRSQYRLGGRPSFESSQGETYSKHLPHRCRTGISTGTGTRHRAVATVEIR